MDGNGQRRPMTMKDVALAAGVGVGTVSRALSGNGHVSEATRQRVLVAAEALTYRPSAVGRGLKLRRTDTLGLVIADITNQFYGEMAAGVLGAAKAAGKHVIVCATNEDADNEREYLDLLVRQRVEAIIAVPVCTNAEAWQDAVALGIRLVFVDRTVDGLATPTVVADNVGGSYEATAHLLRLGHRRIAFLGGPTSKSTGRLREEGFRRAHREAGVEIDESIVRRSRYTWDEAHASALNLLDDRFDATALFAANNILGEAAFMAVRDRGFRVPDDLSLVMFDDIPWSRLTNPALTVVSQPTRDIGQRAVALAADHHLPEGPVVMPTHLVVRDSCRPPLPAKRPRTRQPKASPATQLS